MENQILFALCLSVREHVKWRGESETSTCRIGSSTFTNTEPLPVPSSVPSLFSSRTTSTPPSTTQLKRVLRSLQGHALLEAAFRPHWYYTVLWNLYTEFRTSHGPLCSQALRRVVQIHGKRVIHNHSLTTSHRVYKKNLCWTVLSKTS